MFVLGLETATTQTGVAIGGANGVIASAPVTRGRRHVEALAPAIEFVCEQAGIELGRIELVAVDVGPGLFTGLRVGLATGKALAHALLVPMIGLSSLDLLAFAVGVTNRRIVSVIDALRGEVFYSSYRRIAEGVQRLTEPAVTGPRQLADLLRSFDEACLAVGDGAERYATLLADVPNLEIAGGNLCFPSASTLVEIARREALRGKSVPESAIEPIYLREPHIHDRASE